MPDKNDFHPESRGKERDKELAEDEEEKRSLGRDIGRIKAPTTSADGRNVPLGTIGVCKP